MNNRRRIAPKTRMTIGLIAVALASLWALSVSYDISRAEMLRFLLGSALTLLAAMLAAVILVVVVKGVALLIRRLRGSDPDS